MPTYDLYASSGAVIKYEEPNTQFQEEELLTHDATDTSLNNVGLHLKFESIDEWMKFKRIEGIGTGIYVQGGTAIGDEYAYIWFGIPYAKPVESTWQTIVKKGNYNNSDKIVPSEIGYLIDSYLSSAPMNPVEPQYAPGGESRRPFDYGIGVRINAAYSNKLTVETSKGTHKPFLRLEYTDELVGMNVAKPSPTSGYASKHQPSTFNWTTIRNGMSYVVAEPASAALLWRESDGGTIHRVPFIDGSITQEPSPVYMETYVHSGKVAGGAFTADQIQWAVEVTANSGVVKTSDWNTLTTVDSLSTARAVSPSGQILDSRAPILFTWEHVISTGTEQTGFDLQTSTDGVQWVTLASETTNRNTYLASANTFLAGKLYWRVRTYNSDGVAGEWSAPLMTSIVGSPLPPSITVESNQPQWSIRWSQQGQQGYEVEFDGVRIASAFGQESRYQYQNWADPGAHVVRVRIQNEYSLWSDWGTASITIVNMPGETIILTATKDSSTPSVALSWTGASDRYIIYRNKQIIGETMQQEFVDQFGAGDCTYQVRGVSDSNGYYTISDPVTVTILPENLMLYDIHNKVWCDIARSATQTRDTKETMTRAASFLHFAGSEKPSVEFGEATDRSISFVCAFMADEYGEKAKFEASVGGMVCLKLPDGKSIVGALNAYTRNATTFYTVYQASVIEAEFDEVASNG